MAGILSGLRGLGRNTLGGAGYTPLTKTPPLRAAPNEPDDQDSDRIAYALRDYNRQTDTLLIADRQIEYNVRMLCNQQWNFWSWEAGQFVDVADWFTADEQKWRQLPTINDELLWFTTTHSRLTENPPILTWNAGPDASDADVAELLDILVKRDWRTAGMPTLHPEIMMWLVVAGRGHCVTRLDLTKGDWQPWIGQSQVPLADGMGQPIVGLDGQPMLSQDPVDNVPIGPDGMPRAMLAPNGQLINLGRPHMERTGGIAVDVPSPLQVRGEWGPQMWHQKRWHAYQRFMTPEQVWETWQVEVEPDVNAEGAANVAILERVLYGAGFYGTSRGVTGGAGYPGQDVKGPLCTVIERWDAPYGFDERLLGTWAEPMMETPENPGGRHSVITPKKVIIDGPREVRWPHTSPIRCFDFLRLPGRPRGVTPLESLHSPQRFQNKIAQLCQDYVQLNGSPQRIVFEGFGIQADDIDNAPNRVYAATGTPADGPPIVFLQPPSLNSDLFRIFDVARQNLQRLGGLPGTRGEAPTPDPSGELVKELRFNADRDLGDTSRRSAEEYGRLGMDWKALYPLIYHFQQVMAIGGKDNAARTITVWPELFQESNVDAQADAESMLPEGRGERQARAYKLWQDGAFGMPNDPEKWAEATETFLEMSRFPNYAKLARPGGPDTVMAERENGRLLMGDFDIQVLPWYDDITHLRIHEKFMKGPDFLDQPEIVQMAFAFHRLQHIQSLQEKMARQAIAAGHPPGTPPGAGGAPAQGSPGESKGTSTDAESASLPKSQGGATGRGPGAPSSPHA